jgi:hypothetical protein
MSTPSPLVGRHQIQALLDGLSAAGPADGTGQLAAFQNTRLAPPGPLTKLLLRLMS